MEDQERLASEIIQSVKNLLEGITDNFKVCTEAHKAVAPYITDEETQQAFRTAVIELHNALQDMAADAYMSIERDGVKVMLQKLVTTFFFSVASREEFLRLIKEAQKMYGAEDAFARLN